MSPNVQEQLDKYLTDVHAIELQALQQLRAAPGIAGDEGIASVFSEHQRETEDHERRVRGRLEARGASPNKLKDVVGRLTGVPFVLFAKSQPDTTGKLVTHAYSYEHLELAAYQLLRHVAHHASDQETVELASSIGAQERSMGERLAENFDRSVEVSLREVAPEDMGDQLTKYLEDAHAIEAQAIRLLSKGPEIAGDPELARLYEEHLEDSRRHQQLIEDRLHAHGSGPSRLKDAAMRLGAVNWGAFFAAQPDTPGKLAGFAYAFEHLEAGAYEHMKRVARRAGDTGTEAAAERILQEERAFAEHLESRFDVAMDASLRVHGVLA
jgi:ferritin-like metal-binding protein YciE